jgi:Zn finger protein HypA/HybF involved in hydrogenase expression
MENEMNWHLEDFLMMESFDPGSVFGQLDIVCEECNCPYIAHYSEASDMGFCCPNCGSLHAIGSN